MAKIDELKEHIGALKNYLSIVVANYINYWCRNFEIIFGKQCPYTFLAWYSFDVDIVCLIYYFNSNYS